MAYAAIQPYGRPALGAALAVPPIPGMPPLPVIRTEADAVAFVQGQAAAFATPKVQGMVAAGRTALQTKFSVKLPSGTPMAVQEAGSWAQSYIAENGLPKSPADVASMGEHFVRANAALVGVPPEAIAAVNLVTNMPKTPAEGAKWAADLGKSYAENFGIPLSTGGLEKAAARAAAANFGIDPNVVDLGVSLIRDGKIDASDVETIAIAAASYAGAAAFSAIGIPAPIGAMIGSFVGQAVIGMVKNLFGPQDMEIQNAAYEKALAARNARMAQCETAGKQAWTAYNQMWDATLQKLSAILESPDIAPALAKAGGVRFFGVFYDPANPAFTHFCLVPGMKNEADPNGCLYFCAGTFDARLGYKVPNCEYRDCDARYKPGMTGLSIGADSRTAYCDDKGQSVIPMRRDYSSVKTPIGTAIQAITLEAGGKINGRIDPQALLHQWWADRYVGFPSAGGGATDTDAIHSAAYVPYPSGKGTYQGDCAMWGSMDLLTANLQRLQDAATHVMEDVIRTVAWQTAQDAAQKAKADADRLAQLQAQQTAVQATAASQALQHKYAVGLKPDELVAFQKCARAVPPAGYAGCRSLAITRVAAMTAAAAAAAQATVRRKRTASALKWGVAVAVVGAGVYWWRSTQRS